MIFILGSNLSKFLEKNPGKNLQQEKKVVPSSNKIPILKVSVQKTKEQKGKAGKQESPISKGAFLKVHFRNF